MHFQCPYSGDEHGNIRLKTAKAALHIPELFKTDISSKATFGNIDNQTSSGQYGQQ